MMPSLALGELALTLWPIHPRGQTANSSLSQAMLYYPCLPLFHSAILHTVQEESLSGYENCRGMGAD